MGAVGGRKSEAMHMGKQIQSQEEQRQGWSPCRFCLTLGLKRYLKPNLSALILVPSI